MLDEVIFGLLTLLVILAARLLSDRVKLPWAVLLTVIGLLYALLPGRNITLDPELVLVVVLPPLLYSAALQSSLLAIRANLRVVTSLSVVLVLITALSVGVTVAAIIPGAGLAVGVAFGAAVSPPDPVASLSVGRRAGLPGHLITLIEGEGLLNDATALTTYSVAVAAAVGSGFSFRVAIGEFALAAVGGVVVGVVVAFALRLARPLLRDPLVANAVSLSTPFAAYVLGEEIHVSGVLAVVIAGLIIGHDAPRAESGGAGRLQTTAVWRLVDFVVEGFVVLLIGQQLPPVVRGLSAYGTGTIVAAALASVAVVLAVRPIWLVITNYLPGFLHARLGGGGTRGGQLSGRELTALTWSGTRGVISLATAFALPLTTNIGDELPGRDLLLFCTYVVVLVTLVGQGATFAPLLRRIGVRSDPSDAARRRNEARAASVDAALDALPDIATDEDVPADVLDTLRAQLTDRRRRYQSRLDALAAAEDGPPDASSRYDAALRARRAVLSVQREELLRWRDAGRLADSELRALQSELDHEERILPDRG